MLLTILRYKIFTKISHKILKQFQLTLIWHKTYKKGRETKKKWFLPSKHDLFFLTSLWYLLTVCIFFFRLRCLIHWIVTKKVFDMFIMFVIVLSSVALASEDPVSENSERNKILGYADYGFTAIFTLECSLKVIQLANIGTIEIGSLWVSLT